MEVKEEARSLHCPGWQPLYHHEGSTPEDKGEVHQNEKKIYECVWRNLMGRMETGKNSKYKYVNEVSMQGN